ncbi:MAG: DUF2273 domain-containing protein [Firmicutes bacterium]|nr:DUF2273 domain-containing protein [Bacillota bacterium]
MEAEFFIKLWHNHKGKIIGVLGGLVFALFVISFGFLEALFICICIALGFYLGKRIDMKINHRQSTDDIFKN